MKRAWCVVLLWMLAAASYAGTSEKLAGTKAGVKYSSSVEADGAVTVTLDVLASGFSITMKLDKARNTYSLRANAVLTNGDIEAFRALYGNLKHEKTQANDALDSLLSLLIERGTEEGDEPILIERTNVPWESYCKYIGQTVEFHWDEYEKEYRKIQTVGPCGSDGCFGRCGNGCGTPPEPDVQRFTYECIVHDACTRHSGKILGPCKDEWEAAVLGYAAAPDCQVMSSDWLDNWNEEWEITELGRGILVGLVDTDLSGNPCGLYEFTGSRNNFSLQMTAQRIEEPPVPQCCEQFTFKGSTYCNQASGVFNNICNNAGFWTMERLWSDGVAGPEAIGSPTAVVQ